MFGFLPVAFAQDDALDIRQLLFKPGIWCDVVEVDPPVGSDFGSNDTVDPICGARWQPPVPPAPPAPPGPKLKIAIAALRVDGDGVQNVEPILKKNSPQLKYCYESALKADPSLTGRTRIEARISGGRVTDAAVLDRLGEASFEACMVAKVKRWVFPPEVEGGFVGVWTFDAIPAVPLPVEPKP